MKLDEASKIYRALFSSEIPEVLRSRFASASKLLEAQFSPEEVSQYQKIITSVKDLEALEYAARVFRKHPILCKKFAIMVLLAETLPQNYSIFINDIDRSIRAWALLAVAPLISFYKLVKGSFILRLKAGKK